MIHVNDKVITESRVMTEMQYHPAASQREAMLKAAESLVIGELLRQRAAQLGLAVSEDGIEASDDDFIEALLEREVTIPQATAEECEHYYRSNPERFTSSPLLEARHILIAVAPDDDEGRVTAKAQAVDLLTELRAGASFAAAAEACSACPSKAMGGSLGQISKGQTVPEFERQVFSAEPGLLERPVESRYGFHVVFIERKIPGNLLPYETVGERVAAYLNEKVRRKAIAQYIETLIAGATIEGYDFKVSSSPLLQ